LGSHIFYCWWKMRRSKSDPSKYTRNYRRISQRHDQNTNNNTDNNNNNSNDADADADAEINRLRTLLLLSSSSGSRGGGHPSSPVTMDDDDDNPSPDNHVRSTTRLKRSRVVNEPVVVVVAAASSSSAVSSSILTKELRKDLLDNNCYGIDSSSDGVGDEDEKDIASSSSSKQQQQQQQQQRVETNGKDTAKTRKGHREVTLTAQEIRHAKKQRRNMERKLMQLETRKVAHEKRKILLEQLQNTAISSTEQSFLASSGQLCRRHGPIGTKRQRLRMALQKEQAGLPLSSIEHDMLYQDHCTAPRETIMASSSPMIAAPTSTNITIPSRKAVSLQVSLTQDNDRMTLQPNLNSSILSSSITVACPKLMHKSVEQTADAGIDDDVIDNNVVVAGSQTTYQHQKPPHLQSNTTVERECDQERVMSALPNSDSSQTSTSPLSFAAQMMASIAMLKSNHEDKKSALHQEEVNSDISMHNKVDDDYDVNQKKNRYIPSKPILLKDPASLGIIKLRQSAATNHVTGNVKNYKRHHQHMVQIISRPPDVEKSRYELPVSSMEFEIVDAVRNNDVTIICGETGSGKRQWLLFWFVLFLLIDQKKIRYFPVFLAWYTVSQNFHDVLCTPPPTKKVNQHKSHNYCTRLE
jgi:hypothetical protein